MSGQLEPELTQFDPLMEAHLSFEPDHLPAEVPVPEIPSAMPGFSIHDSETLPVRNIVIPRRLDVDSPVDFEIMSPEERVQHHLDWIRETDKLAIKNMTDSSAGGNTVSVNSWTKQMRLKSTRNLCKQDPDTMDFERQTHDDCECGMCFSVDHGYGFGTLDLEDQNAHKRTPFPKDILDMSWPEQRSFRWRDPDGYDQWVSDLKEEMGPHFDESIVLPEYKFGERPKKARELVEPDNIVEIVDDYLVSVNAHFA